MENSGLTSGNTDQRDELVTLIENSTSSDARCSYWQQWQASAWKELADNPGLAHIGHVDTGFAADHDDEHAFCPFCGHKVNRRAVKRDSHR